MNNDEIKAALERIEQKLDDRLEQLGVQVSPTGGQMATLAAAGLELQRIPDDHFPSCRVRGCDEPGKHTSTGRCVEHRAATP